MSHKLNIIIVSSLIVLAFGLTPLVFVYNADCADFARSGALLVLYGLYLAFGEIKLAHANQNVANVWKKGYEKTKSFDSKKLPTTEQEMSAYLKNATKHNALEQSPSPIEVQLDIDAINRENNSIVKAREFWVVAVGTFIWGYGDILCQLL